MKKLILFSLIALCTMTYGQKFIVTPDGLRDANDNEKTYVVINCEGKSAKELYENAIKYINQNYLIPNEVIKGKIESEYLSLETYSPSAISFRRSGGHPTYDVKYRTELSFKDGRVKYEIQSIEMVTEDGYPLYFSGNPLTAVAIFNHKGELKYEEAKTKVENYFNNEVIIISNFLKGTKLNDEW